MIAKLCFMGMSCRFGGGGLKLCERGYDLFGCM